MKGDFWFALYVFCADYHSGQNSRLYRILSKLSSQYKMKVTDSMFDEMRNSLEYKELEMLYSQDRY